MTTTASSLIEQVRSRLLDYGNGAVTLAAAVSDTTGTSVSLSDIADISKGLFIMVDNEMMEVLDTFEGTPDTATVIRGSRGSTAATHSSGAIVRIEPVYGNHEYLRALNQAQDSSFPALYQVSDTHATAIAASTYEYAIPAACHLLARVEIETSTADIFEVSRNWGYQSENDIIIEDAGSYPAGRAIRFIGYGKFDAMTISGNLDTDFPETNANAIEYLVVKATANLLRGRQAPIARRDSFIGITDSFQQAAPFMSTLSANDYEKQAKSILKQVRMPRLEEYVSDPGRVYFGRP
jgi:hypothetical protein